MFWVGLTNTLLVAGIGVFFATIVGFTMGIARLSSNWLISRLALVYVEALRNTPLLLQIFVWWDVLRLSAPQPRKRIVEPPKGHLPTRSRTNAESRGLRTRSPRSVAGSTQR